MFKQFFFFFSFLLLVQNFYGQNYYRLSGEYSIKSKGLDNSQLVIGKFYYDVNEAKIIHCNTFPENEKWITSDTNLYKVVDGEIVERQTIPDFTDFSIYNLILNNKLNDFGLSGSIYTIENVKKENGLVISTWAPNKNLKQLYGKIMLSIKDNNLFGIIFFNADGELIKKQFFEDYIIYETLAFPSIVTEITYLNGNEIYQVTNYKNIKINDKQEDSKYYFDPGAY